MRISIFSDIHCGFGRGMRENDPFIALKEALEISRNCDVILIAGDIFDTRVPKQEVFARTAKIFTEVQQFPSRTELKELIGKDIKEVSPLALRGIPVIAIHGNHERRSRELINPVQALEHAGLVINLHCAAAVFEVNGEKIAIHGMGAVPERYARDVLLEWDPKPVKGAKNILMLHQSIGEYIYSPLEPPSLRLEDLPDGFDLYILGHLHWHDVRDYKAGKLLLPGSLIPTTPKKIEAEQEKGVWIWEDNNLRFVPLKFQRKIYFKEFEASKEVKEKVRSFLSSVEKGSIVSVKIKGKSNERIEFRDLLEEFGKVLDLKIKSDIITESEEDKIQLLELIREQKLSPEELGKEMLRKNAERLGCKLKIDEIFDLLAGGDVETAFVVLKGEQKTLGGNFYNPRSENL